MLTGYFGYKLIGRWLVSSLGVWIASIILSGVSLDDSVWAVLLAGLVVALANVLLRPILIFLSLPALLLSLGLFMLIVNGMIVLVADWLYSGLQVDNIWWATLAGIVITLVNYLLTSFFDSRGREKHE